MSKFTDIHSHIAWDIDDGIPSRAEAEKALAQAADDNILAIASTPHMIPGTTDLEEISARQQDLKQLASKYGITIRSGAELFLNRSAAHAISEGFVKPYEGTRYQLCEFDVRRDLHDIDYYEEPLYEIEMKKLVPVVAHVERYFCDGLDLNVVTDWFNQGYVLQVNRTSLQGMHGKTIQKNAWKLIEEGLAHVVATDTHRTSGSRITKLSDIYMEIEKKYGSEIADILLVENPARILQNEEVIDLPEIRKKKRFLFF